MKNEQIKSDNEAKVIAMLNTPIPKELVSNGIATFFDSPEDTYLCSDNNSKDNKQKQKKAKITQEVTSDKESSTTNDSTQEVTSDKESSTTNDSTQKVIPTNKIFDNDSNWYYVVENQAAYGNSNGKIYNIDKDGNLIASLSIQGLYSSGLNQLEGNIISQEDKEQILKNITNSIEQINFLPKQKELAKEIKGFPEINEPILKILDLKDVCLKFKDERSLIRAIFIAKDNDIFKALLSIAALNKVDLFNQLIDKQIFRESDFRYYFTTSGLDQACKTIYETMIYWVDEYSKMPSVEFLLSQIQVPYYKEIVDRYLWDEETIKTWVDANYIKMKEHKFNYLLEEIRKGKIKGINSVIDSLSNIEETYKPYDEKLQDPYNDLKEYIESKENEVTLFTGIKPLDDKQFTIAKGKICSVFAYTGSFKTMFCTNVAYKLLGLNTNVVYMSLEIDKREMYINFLSRYSYDDGSPLSHSDIKCCNLGDNDKKYLFEELQPNFTQRRKNHLIIFDETDLTTNTQSECTKLLSNAENEFIKRTGHGVDLLIVDHINLLKFSEERKMNDYAAVNHWMSYFRKNAIDFLGTGRQIAILCAAQSSREGFKEATKNKGKYSLTNIAEGNEIERSSSYVLSIYTSDDDKKANKTKMQILKYRDGNHTDDLLEVLIDPKYYAFGVIENLYSSGDTKMYNIPGNNISSNSNTFCRPSRKI